MRVLALRAADWVPEVRSRARQACQRYLDRAPIEAVTFLAPVALALRARQAGSWLADAMDTLFRDGPPEALTTALAAEDWRTRRAAHLIGLRAGRIGVDKLMRAATTDGDLPIRIMCAEAAIRAARAAGNRDVPRRLLASGTAAIRAEALGAVGEVGAAIEALPDRSALVRATAQVIVRRAGTDPAARYRALLTERQPPSPQVIAGLGETGAHTDEELLRSWLAHPSSRGRAETVRALRRLGCTSAQLLLPLLTDAVSSERCRSPDPCSPRRARSTSTRYGRCYSNHSHPMSEWRPTACSGRATPGQGSASISNSSTTQCTPSAPTPDPTSPTG